MAELSKTFPHSFKEMSEDAEVDNTFFDCSSGVKNDSFTILKSGFITDILSFEKSDIIENKHQSLLFCGKSFVTDSIFIAEERASILKHFRSCIFRLMRQASVPCTTIEGSGHGIGTVRNDITRMWLFFYDAIKGCKHAILPEIELILTDFISLSDSVGHLPQLVKMFSQRKLFIDSNLKALFHIHLELSMHYMMILFLIASKYPDVGSYQTKLSLVSHSIVNDLISFLNNLYSLPVDIDNLISTDQFFMCGCLKEFWLILIIVIDTAWKRFSLRSFWSLVSTILQGCDISDLQKIENKIPSYSVQFRLLFLCKIAPLYWFDHNGKYTYDVMSVVPRNWLMVEEIISEVVSNSEMNDLNLRSLLWVCIYLTKHWDGELSIFCSLWEYFNKELNNMEYRSPQVINKFASAVQTPCTKFDSCLNYLTELDSLNESHSNFDLFLYFLVATVKQLKVKKQPQVLSQIKGRIYSKFHKRRMVELNLQGLDRFTTLLTVLALTMELDELPTKMCALISLLDMKHINGEVKKHVLIILFVCLLLCKRLALPAQNVVKKITDVFSKLITLLETKKNREQYLEDWDLISFYLDCVEQSFDFNLVISDEKLLICSGYSKLLRISNEKQRRRTYMHFNAILSSSFMHHHKRDVYDLMWEHIYISLSEIDCRSEAIAEVYAGLTLLSLERNPEEEDSNFKQLISKYGFNSESFTPFKCLYLSRIISSSSFIEIIDAPKSNYLIKFWIMSVIEQLYKSAHVLELTRAILRVPRLLRQPIIDCSLQEHVETILMRFISDLGKTYTSMQALDEICEFRKKINLYFSEIVKISEAVVLTGSCEKSVLLAFRIGGQLVLHCARAIYSKTSPICLLPQLLNLFVLPLTSSKKPLSSIYTNALKTNIHLFISGLATLDSKKDDFVARKVKEVMQKYFLDFCIKPRGIEQVNNPFLVSLSESFTEYPIKPACHYRHLVLQYIKDHFLYFPQSPEQLHGILSFLIEVAERTKSIEELIHSMKILSMKMVSCVLVCDAMGKSGEPRGIRKLALSILRKIVSPIHTDDTYMKIFQNLLQEFLSDNIGYYQGTLLKTMVSVNLIAPIAIKRLLPYIEVLISEQEKKRGVGVDQALHESFQYLQKRCL